MSDSTELANPSGTRALTRADLERFLGENYPQAPEQVKSSFLYLAEQYGLNPFLREIHLIGFGKNWTAVIGFPAYLRRADNHQDCDGWEVNAEVVDCFRLVGGEFAASKDLVATATVWRKSWSHPVKVSVSLTEYGKRDSSRNLTGTWRDIPETMIKKVALVQALRQAFPNHIGGMPYTEEELDGAAKYRDVGELRQPQGIAAEPRQPEPEPVRIGKPIEEEPPFWTQQEAEAAPELTEKDRMLLDTSLAELRAIQGVAELSEWGLTIGQSRTAELSEAGKIRLRMYFVGRKAELQNIA